MSVSSFRKQLILMTFISGPEYIELVFSLTPSVSIGKTLFDSSNVLVLFLP